MPEGSQDIRLQMGEQVHTEMHYPQHKEGRTYPKRHMAGSYESNASEKRLPPTFQNMAERYERCLTHKRFNQQRKRKII